MISNAIIETVSFLLAGFLISYLINKFLLRFSKSLGIRNKNDILVRWSNTSKPSLGGVSLYFSFVFAVFIYAIIFTEDNIFENIEFIGLLGASSVAFLIGIVDDAYNTRPLLKLFGQISCGVILVVTHNSIDFFHETWLDGLLTIFWIVAVMNSLNMLDNMDGITGTVSFYIIVSCIISLYITNGANSHLWILLMIMQLGGILGFMTYNLHPSKLFMGDSGSQFIGLFVGFFGIKTIWNLPSYLDFPSWIGLFLILVAFTPTIADTLSVMINRKRKGGSIMVGGKDHTTHHLVYKGLNDLQVWMIFFVISTFSAIIVSLLTYYMSEGNHLLTLIGIPYFLIIFIFLYRNTLKYPPPKEE